MRKTEIKIVTAPLIQEKKESETNIYNLVDSPEGVGDIIAVSQLDVPGTRK